MGLTFSTFPAVFRTSREKTDRWCGAPSCTAQPTGQSLTSDTSVQSLTSDTFVQSLPADTSVQSLTSDTFVQSLPADTSVQSLASDTSVQFLTSDTFVQSLTSDTSVQSLTSDTSVQSLPADTFVQFLTSDTFVQSLPADTFLQSLPADTFLQSLLTDTSISSLQDSPPCSWQWLPCGACWPFPSPTPNSYEVSWTRRCEPICLAVLLSSVVIMMEWWSVYNYAIKNIFLAVWDGVFFEDIPASNTDVMMSWCLMSSDVIWHIRDKLWPMPKHGSIKATYVRCMRVLAVTCHLHFWQNDRDFLRATVVTRGWNGYRNKSQHRKSTLEKKILPPFQQGFEPATFQSRVRRSNHWAIPAPSLM